MAVKTADDAGTVTEKVIRTRTLPAGNSSSEDDSSKPWRVLGWSEYLHGLSAAAWSEHVVYLYRYDDKGNTWAAGKFTSALDEFKIQETFGGGFFNVKVKKGPQLIINEDVRIEGAAKTPTPATSAATPGGAAVGGDALLMAMTALIDELRAARGGNVQGEVIRNALSLQGQVFGAGVEAVRGTLAAGGAPAASGSPMKDALEFLSLAKNILAPAGPATNSVKDTLEMIASLKAAGIFGGGGEGKTTMAMELVRQLPTVANAVIQGAEQWRMGMEAVARAESLRRGGGQPQPISVAPGPTPMPAAPPAPAPAAATPAETALAGAPANPISVEQMEIELCDLVADESMPLEQAAKEGINLIERALPGQGMLDRILMMGEEGTVTFFATRPILQRVSEHPRLRPFVQKVLETIKQLPVLQPPNPAAPPA
jgi:hypothetical protein